MAGLNERAYYEAGSLWHAERYDQAEERERFAAAASLIPATDRSLLDVGAGQGSFLQWLDEDRPELALAGLERSETAVAAAVCRTRIDVGSVEALPYADQQFDVITALEVLEHLPHETYAKGRTEVARVAASAVIVSVPYSERLTQVRCPECGCRFHPNYHMRSFAPGTLESLFDGFVLDRHEVLHFDDYVGGPAIRAAYRLIRGGTNEMLPGNLCPQCGYREAASGALRAWARGSVKSRLPKVSRPRWLLARFMRR